MASSRKTRRRLLGGSGELLKNPRNLHAYVSIYAVDDRGFEFFRNVQSAVELRPRPDGCFDAFESSENYEGNDAVERIARKIRLPSGQWKENRVFYLRRSERGPHVLGGPAPANLQIPKHKRLKTSFQYIGSISGKDPELSWIGRSHLHIVYPVFECNFGINIDWKLPDRPRVVDPVTFSRAWWDKDQSGWEKVEFDRSRFVVSRTLSAGTYEKDDTLILCGVPLWLQGPFLPKCPETGQFMRFVCQIQSTARVRVPRDKQGKNLPFGSDSLNFGDGGNLYVFYHPRSKIMYVTIQF